MKPTAADSLHLIPLGGLRGARRFMVQDGGDEEVVMPIVAFLVISDERKVLVDTGMSPAAFADHEQAWGKLSRFFSPVVQDEDRLDRRLAELAVAPGDITDVVLTHLHFDHAGGVALLPNATHWVQRAEYRAALYPDRHTAGGYLPQEWSGPSDAYTLLDGDDMVAPGIHVIATPGHTPGHQSVLVNLGSAGWFCLVGDVVDSREILDRRRTPGVIADLGQALLSAQRLRALEQSLGAVLLFTHDHEQHEQLPRFPSPLATRPVAEPVA